MLESPRSWDELARIDPATAARLKPTDAQRIQRALEVFQLTGLPISALQTRAAQAKKFPYTVLKIGLLTGLRSVLHERIAARFDAMLTAGLVEELTGLRSRYALTAEMPAMRCVGYRQAWEFLDGEIDRQTLREKSVAATRQLAKRQFTWLRAMQGIEAMDCLRPDLHEDAAERIGIFLRQD